MSRALVIALALVAACAPYYRDDELRGRRALDRKEIDAAVARARLAADARQPAEAARILRAMIDGHPFVDASQYVAWAKYAAASGQTAAARAVLRARIAQLGGGADSVALRRWIVASYVDDRWIARAIVETGIDDAKLAAELAGYPELEAALQPLVDAWRAADPARARSLLVAWLDGYGEPDHPGLAALVEDTKQRLERDAHDGARGAELEVVLARARTLVETDPRTALMIYAEAHRHVSAQRLASHRDGIARALRSIKDPADADPVAAQLVADGDRAAAAGELGDALARYRRAVLHAPWWPEARRRLARVLDATGATEPARAQVKAADDAAAALAP